MKTVFITGVARGLGHELFRYALQRGHRVFGLVRSEETRQALQQEFISDALLVLADLNTDSCMEKIRSAVSDTPIDLLINNAGIGGETFSLDAATADEIMRLFNIHCLGAFRVTKALKENLLRSDNPVVLNMNSRFGSLSRQYEGAFKDFEVSYSYRIAKASQNMLTNCLRNDLPEITFASVTPGKMITRLAQKDAELLPAEAAKRIIDFWEEGKFRSENGIFQVPDQLTPW